MGSPARQDGAAARALGVPRQPAKRRGAVVIETEPRRPAPLSYTRRSYTAPPGKQLYEATGGCGITSVRASAIEMQCATSVADPAAPTERLRQGVIRSFFPSKRDAEIQATLLRDQGLVVTIVPARPYRGPNE